MSIAKEDINAALKSILSNLDLDFESAYRKVSAIEAVKKAAAHVRDGNPPEFEMALLYPLQKIIHGLLDTEVTGADPERLKFLFIQYGFVERHFKELILAVDGTTYSTDRSRNLMRCLAKSLIDGKEIAFNYDQKYTYHLPKRIFKTHEEISTFFQALYMFYYGHSGQFIAFINRMKQEYPIELMD